MLVCVISLKCRHIYQLCIEQRSELRLANFMEHVMDFIIPGEQRHKVL